MGLRKSKHTISLTAPFNAYYILIVALSTAFLLSITIQRINHLHHQSAQKMLSQTIPFVESAIDDNQNKKRTLQHLADRAGLHISLFDVNGVMYYDSHQNVPDNTVDQTIQTEIRHTLYTASGTASRFSNTFGETRFFYAERAGDSIIRLSISENELGKTRSAVVYAAIVATILLLSFLLILHSGVSRRITNPILESIHFAEEFTRKNFSKRILNYSDNDIGILQQKLNTLADSLETHVHDLIFEQNKIQAAINHINDSLAVIGLDTTILLANRSFSALFQLSSCTGKKYFEVIRSSKINNMIDKSIQNNAENHFEADLQKKYSYEITLTPIRGAVNFRGVLILFHDITQKKKADRMKTELVGNLSHELKTPIAILKGYLETMQLHRGNTEMCAELLTKSQRNLDRQNSIINDMIKLNMLETDHDFHTETVYPSTLIENCIQILQQKMQSKNITCTVSLHDPSASTHGNIFLAEQIFFNLITNAVNYNKEGGSIYIESYVQKGDTSYTQYLVYTVRDTGIGIPREKITRIFERFYRVDKGRSRSTGGTGLGLAIVKHAAEIMSWQIDVTSNKKGSTFLVYIPFG